MKNERLVVIVLLLGVGALAQNTTSSGKFGSSAIWHPSPDFLTVAHGACDNAPQPPAFAECFIDQIAKGGAPQDTLKFTRELYKSNGQVGILEEYKDFGPVGLAWVVYPLRANDNDGVLLLNGDPRILDPDDMQRLDKAALAHDPLFLAWKKTAPKLDVWPGARAGGAAQVRFARVWAGDKPGEKRFLFSYPLADGCRTCAGSGFANYWWDFDANGKFQGTRLLSVTRGLPPSKRDMGSPPPGAQTPTLTRPSQPGTTSASPGGAPPPPQ